MTSQPNESHDRVRRCVILTELQAAIREAGEAAVEFLQGDRTYSSADRTISSLDDARNELLDELGASQEEVWVVQVAFTRFGMAINQGLSIEAIETCGPHWFEARSTARKRLRIPGVVATINESRAGLLALTTDAERMLLEEQLSDEGIAEMARPDIDEPLLRALRAVSDRAQLIALSSARRLSSKPDVGPTVWAHISELQTEVVAHQDLLPVRVQRAAVIVVQASQQAARFTPFKSSRKHAMSQVLMTATSLCEEADLASG